MLEATVSIYVLFDTRIPSIVRYVGRTAKLEQRIKQHSTKSNKNTRHWVGLVLRTGGKIGFEVITTCQRSESAKSEQFWIEHYREHGDLINGHPGNFSPTTIGCKNCKRMARELRRLKLSAFTQL